MLAGCYVSGQKSSHQQKCGEASERHEAAAVGPWFSPPLINVVLLIKKRSPSPEYFQGHLGYIELIYINK